MFRPYLALIRLTGDQYQLRYKCSLYSEHLYLVAETCSLFN